MKNKTPYKIFLPVLIIIGTWSCERDDICAEITPTTPHLIIRFYDVTDPEVLKGVTGLTVRALDANGINLEDLPVKTPFDSIVLPLRTTLGSITTRFSLEQNTNFRLDTLSATNSNIDIIAVTYTPELVYVSRACGYKSIFTNLSINIIQDTDNWILTNEVLTTTIENEDQAHIILRH